MKTIAIIAILFIIAYSQTTVTPKTQACSCSQLLSLADCNAKLGCSWTASNASNSNNSTNSSLIVSGTCANSTTSIILSVPTYCQNVTNITNCASTIGCAFVNNTCTIFSGCSAYVYTTNSACQAVSTQCTTDGVRCAVPSTCPTYTSQALCSSNIATSGAKTCTWTTTGSTGTCQDKQCQDAPISYSTNTQCSGWITGCLTNGKGCATTLAACSTYTQAAGCSGMIGSDGPCTSNTTAGSTVCRALVCTDAASTLATNTACSGFLTGCVTTGKGCVATLAACSSYTQTQGCTGLIGSDGPCTSNSTAGSSACRALACTDAPASTNTNSGCNTFLVGCVTTGQGCINILSTCSSYTGTKTTCSSFVGTDGNCKGTSATSASCAARQCVDAAITLNTDAACNTFQTGCVTNGAGCVQTLGLCSSYQGTNTTCLLYKGSDGNCTAPSSQTAAASCVVKVCSDAPSTTTTNLGCQAFSYKCVTNGAGCITPTTCEASLLAISCQGNSSCSSNQICINRSNCVNYTTQSLCLQNQQQYVSGGTTYLRNCWWDSVANTCSNTLCSSQATSLTTDAACQTALSECLTKGAGCVDINDPCQSYQGTTSTCQGFKGVNGTKVCTQLNSVTAATTPCLTRNSCNEAKTQSLSSITQSSNTTCSAYLQGCFFDGKDNCTNGDCTTYFGTQDQCNAIKTAVSSGNAQACWKTASPTDSTTACIPKTCAHAVPSASNLFNTNTLCSTFLSTCVWTGNQAGGCQDASTACTSYIGSVSACNNFSSSGMACTKTTGICKIITCTQKSPPSTLTTAADKAAYCQGIIDSNGLNCKMGSGATCVVPIATSGATSGCVGFIAIGADQTAKNTYCFSLKIPGTDTCGYTAGDTNCSSSTCANFAAVGTTADQKYQYCKSVVKIDGVTCGLASATSTTCSNQACSDYGVPPNLCPNLLDGNTCYYASILSICVEVLADCTSYNIPVASQGSQILKAIYCSALFKRYVDAEGYSNKCSFTGTGNTCTAPVNSCSNIAIDASLTSNYDKLIFCQNSKTKDQSPCTVSATPGTNCEARAACTAYAPFLASGVTASDATRQISCQSQFDGTTKKPCNYSSATPTTCAAISDDCTAYKTYGADLATNQALCNIYKADGQNTCAYLGTGNSCKAPVCTEQTNPSAINCVLYNKTCTFDGLGCVTYAGCDTYTAQTNGSGKAANCQALVTEPGIIGLKCGLATPDATKCSYRACTDITSGAAPGYCTAYFSDCQNFGDKCILTQSCDGYTLSGTTDAEKVVFCSKVLGTFSVRCTYKSGDSACSTAEEDCSTYQVSGFTVSATVGCNNLINATGQSCKFNTGSATCASNSCNFAPATIQTDAQCASFLKGCELDLSSACSALLCSSAAITLTTNAACAQFRVGCVTNGAGCLEVDQPCTDYKGNALACQAFKGIKGTQPCNNTPSAAATDSCINRTCSQNTTAKSNADCANWYPSTTNVANCVWNGTSGCVAPQACASFTGTSETCPTYIATDGPCQGTGTSGAPCFAYVCTSAPATYSTDASCKTWGPTCITNGFGCINSGACTSILSPLACPLYKSTLSCDLASQCKTKPSNCGQLTTASECNNTPLLGQTTPTCSWNTGTSACGIITCALLPVTLGTDQACSAQISTCTTNGAGCITKGACSTYPKIACGPAATTDTQKVCIWSNSACRPIQCTDNTSATSDAACNTYLAGCRTTGTGCALTFTCSQITLASLCLSDTSGYPCSWYKQTTTSAETCINYAKCTDIISSSHSACQAASPLCTTNGVNCIAITGCSNTVAQASCIIGTDGNCGWLPATGTTAAACALYTNCSAATGTTTAQCQAWGSTCISNGTACISRSTCSSYSTQIACGNAGTDGTCFWVTPTGTATTGTCRLQLCSDATTNLTTHAGCVAFAASTACTTSGTACISQSTCSQYLVQAGCVQGTDGVCFWATTTTAATNTTAASNQSVCRLKQCTDSLLTSSSSCTSAIAGVKCVSNGVNCIPQSTCSSYTAREACLGGGSDGVCAFTPGSNATTPNVGTCQQFSQCQNANSDQTACNTRLDACFFNSTTTNGTTTSSCSPHTCATKALGQSCQPVPSWDLSTYQICVLAGTTCAAGSPSLFTAQSCYSSSVMTYTWNQTAQTCGPCLSQQSNNVTNNNTNLTNTFGNLISLLTALALIL